MNEEKEFEQFCIDRKWEIYKIPKLPNIKTPDFIVINNNQPFIVEIKKLTESGPERTDIERKEIDGIEIQSGDMWKEVDSIVKKIDESRSQFRTTESFGLPHVIIIYSERKVPLTKELVFSAMYGKVFPRVSLNNDKTSIPPLIVDRTIRRDKNNLISAIGFLEQDNGMFIIHNLWANINLPISIFNYENDTNYLAEELKFTGIKFIK